MKLLQLTAEQPLAALAVSSGDFCLRRAQALWSENYRKQ